MSKSIRRFLSLLLVLQLIIPYSVFAAPGEFTSVVGDVRQNRAKEVIRPVEKSPIQPKDIIITDKASSAMMVFPDNSMIKLEQNSKLEISEFLFKEKSRTAIFLLSIGKMTANVNKFIGGENVFEVHSPTSIVGVRGTGFEFVEAMNAENKNMATVSCTEGSLNLSALSPTGAVVSTAVLEAAQVAVIVGGIITISAITAAVVGAMGSTATTTSAGTAAAATAVTAGLSTTAIVGVAAGVAAVGVAGAAASGGGGGSSSSSGGGSGGGSSSSSGGGSDGCGTSQTRFVINEAVPQFLQSCTNLNDVCAGQMVVFYQGVGRWPTVDEARKALVGQYAVISLDGSPLNVYYEGITLHQGNGIPDGYGDHALANWVATSGTHTVTAMWTIISPRSSCTFTIPK